MNKRRKVGDEIPEEYRLPPDHLLEEMFGTDVREVSGVDVPAIDWPFVLFKSVKSTPYGPHGKPADVEACVQAILEDPSFQPQEGRTAEESAYAICVAQSQQARARAWRRSAVSGRKQDEPMPAAEEPAAPAPEEAVGGTVELPASPITWPFSDCIQSAMDMELSRDDATAVCQVIGQDFGDPEDPDTILLPDGTDPEALLMSAAVFGGIAQPEGIGGEKGYKPVTLVGHNQWLAHFKRWLGVKAPTPLERLQKEVEELQSKNKEDLRWMLERQDRLLQAILRTQGIELPELEKPVGDAGPAPESAKPEPAPAGADGGDTGKGLKDQVAALMAENAALRAQLQGAGLSPGPAPAPQPELEPQPTVQPYGMLDSVPNLGPPAPIVAQVPQPEPAPQPVLAAAPVTGAPMVDPAKVAHRKSVDPQSGNGNQGMVYSTTLNAYIPAGDRAALRQRR